jgi:hypothetical protein
LLPFLDILMRCKYLLQLEKAYYLYVNMLSLGSHSKEDRKKLCGHLLWRYQEPDQLNNIY